MLAGGVSFLYTRLASSLIQQWLMRSANRDRVVRIFWSGIILAWFSLVPAVVGLMAGLSVDHQLHSAPRFAVALALLGLVLGGFAGSTMIRRRTG
jgi:F0F1-type ATP synthase assembly protein I